MLAHRLSTCHIICLGVIPICSAQAAGPDLQLYLKSGGFADSIRGEMKTQTDVIMRDAGFGVGWWDSQEEVRVTNGHLLVVEFHGVCAPAERGNGRESQLMFSRLASTAVVDGKVLPFIQVDCDEVSRLLRSKCCWQTRSRQAKLYARALARVLAHEIYHAIGQTTKHTSKGLTKARVCADELMDENFGFSQKAIDQLHAPEPADPALGSGVVAAGGS